MQINPSTYEKAILPNEFEFEKCPFSPDLTADYFDFSGIDTSVSIADDFYRFACGKWLDNTPIPDTNPSWGTFDILEKKVNDNLNAMIKDFEGSKSKEECLCKTFFDGIMNMEMRNLFGIKSLQPMLEQIYNIDSKKSLLKVTVELMKIGVSPFATFRVFPNPYNNSKPIVFLEDGGIGLPDNDMYLKEKDKEANRHAEKRDKYRQYITDLFAMAGLDDPYAAEKILGIETELAKVFLAKQDRWDPDKTNIRPPFGFWQEIFAHLGVELMEVNARNPLFLNRLDVLIEEEPLENLKTYLKFCLLNQFVATLDQSFYDLNFNFYHKELRGTKEPRPLYERAAGAVSNRLGHAIGKIYVQKHFPPEKKQKVLEMVAFVKEALIERIQKLDWMHEPTKLLAIDKVNKMVVEIGYPDDGCWRDYSGLILDKEKTYADHSIGINNYNFQYWMQKLQRSIDKKEWEISPQIVNAYNTWNQNKITLPAGILDHPFFTSDEATTWGAFGMVIAHEISHSFDDLGRKYDADGNKADWWEPKDKIRYEAYSKEIEEQFDSYVVNFEDGTSLNVNGKMTLGENIADLGGLKIAFSAMQKQGLPTIDGITPEHRFFLGFAQVWRMKIRDDLYKLRVGTNSHSPPVWRVNGTLSQMKEFKDAFNLSEDCKMMRPEHLQTKMWG